MPGCKTLAKPEMSMRNGCPLIKEARILLLLCMLWVELR